MKTANEKSKEDLRARAWDKPAMSRIAAESADPTCALTKNRYVYEECKKRRCARATPRARFIGYAVMREILLQLFELFPQSGKQILRMDGFREDVELVAFFARLFQQVGRGGLAGKK